GALIRDDGSALQRGKNDSEFKISSPSKIEEVDYVSAACLLVRRDDFFAVGGFNYRYDPAYYEDSDLCLRFRILDKRAGLLAAASCIHIENATTSDAASAHGAHNVVDHNKSVFLSTWKSYLKLRTSGALP